MENDVVILKILVATFGIMIVVLTLALRDSTNKLRKLQTKYPPEVK